MFRRSPKLSSDIAAFYRDGAFDIAEVMDAEAKRLFDKADDLPAWRFIQRHRYWHTAWALQHVAATTRVNVNSILPPGTPAYEK